MIREVTILLLGFLAVSVTAKAVECSSESAECTVCRATYTFLRDLVANKGMGQSAAEVGKACTCGYIAKSSPEFKQCIDHMDTVPGRLAAFAPKALDPDTNCQFACAGSVRRNASLPACPRTPKNSCDKPSGQLCNVCLASVKWLEEFLSNKPLIATYNKYLDVYCGLSSTPCLEDACRAFVDMFNPMFEVAAYMFGINGPHLCDQFCGAHTENSRRDTAMHISTLLKGVASFVEMEAGK